MKVLSGHKRLDYFPLISFFLFWLLAAAAGASLINDPGITRLGIVTIPAIAAVIASVIKIRKLHRNPDN
jgi:hypothetical protein